MSGGERMNISSGSPREPVLGYSRAVRVGRFVMVAGTTSGGVGDTAEEQTREIIARIATALERADATLADVVRTRVYLTDLERDFDAVGAVHGEVFGGIRPVTATVGVQALAGATTLVEIEVDAILADGA
ncbi:Rid family hydrolase [Homoserinibacter sp. YIM 151385]|uniref:Rid family hydrolase n=1 Tax=Homoserinibacter sp. YIM 151385 TaxID=2985506 RepID=UPI0022F0AD69|nr:Rid family hydrolase [Homoserinibacter sp. YIM 151385]WBU37979.1 Rid family hydrolase [Homoserinibacter sp. YIM 151385]